MVTPIFVGCVLGVGVAAFAHWSRFDRDRSFYPTVLIVIASYYVLFAVIAGEALLVELEAAAVFSVAAVLGATRWPALVGLWIFLHGVFDFARDGIIENAGVPAWWPAFCGSIDIVLGAWVVWLFVRRSRGGRELV